MIYVEKLSKGISMERSKVVSLLDKRLADLKLANRSGIHNCAL